jgi:hypothetical protein
MMSHTNVKQESANRFRCNNPFNAGSDSHAFVVEYTDDAGEYGAFSDHGPSGESGSLYELAERLGVPRAERSSSGAVPRNRMQYLEEYAAAHGAPVDAFLSAGWKETTYKDKTGVRPALMIPTENGPRYRFTDDKKPKYKSGYGVKQCWYKLSVAVALSDARGVPLVMVNGEASVVSCLYHGVAAVAVTASSEKEIPPHLLPALIEAYKKPVIIIALDCDTKGRTSALKLAAQLKTAGYSPRVVDLNLADKQDAADYLRLHTADELYALPDISERAAAERDAALLSVIQTPGQIHEAIQSGADNPARPIVSLRNGSAALLWVGAHILGARPKTYKSMLSLHIADAVSDPSVDLFAAGTYTTARGSVLYLDFEQKPATVDKRMNAMRIYDQSPLQYITATQWKRLVRQQNHEDLTALAFDIIRAWYRNERTHGRTPALVIVDTLSAILKETIAAGTDTHTSDYKYYAAWDDLAVELDSAILLLSHLTKGTRGKNGADPADAVYGSGKLTGAVESIITLTRADSEDAFVTMQSRARDEAIKPTVLQFDAARGHHIIPETVPVNVLNLSKRKALVLTAIHDGHETPAAIAEAVNLDKQSVYNVLTDLTAEKYIRRGEKHGTYEVMKTP